MTRPIDTSTLDEYIATGRLIRAAWTAAEAADALIDDILSVMERECDRAEAV